MLGAIEESTVGQTVYLPVAVTAALPELVFNFTNPTTSFFALPDANELPLFAQYFMAWHCGLIATIAFPKYNVTAGIRGFAFARTL